MKRKASVTRLPVNPKPETTYHYPDRFLVATFRRKKEVLRTIRYSEIDRALPRITYHMMHRGEVGDLCVIHHEVTGKELGTIKMSVSGRLITDYIWDRPPEDFKKK